MPSDITPAVPVGRQIINGYGGGGFTIGGERFTGSVLVLPEMTTLWPFPSVDTVTPESFSALREHESDIEILIYGGGGTMPFLTADFRSHLKGLGVVVEPMDTGAACRTFNILLAEERRVAAALIAVD